MSPHSCGATWRLAKRQPTPERQRLARVGELISVHVIPRPHSSLEDCLPIGKTTES